MKKLLESDKIFFGGLFLIAAIVVVGALFIFSGNKQKPATTDSLVGNNSQILGSKDAKVTIVEFFDFQCPPCREVYPVVKQVLNSYSKDQIRLVFRNFPIVSAHQYALGAAMAAEAAGEQGKFYEYYSLLYEHQQNLDRDSLISYAEELKLDMDKFKKDMDSKANKDKVLADVSDGEKLGVNGTPTFFINGRKYNFEELPTYEQFKSMIDSELKK
jgi:protein-disulfide isomerase